MSVRSDGFRHSPSKSIRAFTPVFAGYAVNALMAQPILQHYNTPHTKGPARCGRPLQSSRLALVYENAARTLSGVNGTRRSRTPVASKMALPMAAAIGRLDG